MIEIKITAEGLEKVRQMLLSKADKMDEAIADAVLKGALDVEADAKKGCPVDTGRLRASITTAMEGFKSGRASFKGEQVTALEMPKQLTAKVGTNVEYAPYVELGTSRQTGQPYLYPALEKNFSRIDKNIREAVTKITKGG